MANMTEAREWIKRASAAAPFAPERFGSREDALDFVYKLYRAGAVSVDVPTEGFGDELCVMLPGEREFRKKVIELCNDERTRVGATRLIDSGQRSVTLSWSTANV